MIPSNRVSKHRYRKPGLSSVERKEQLATAIQCFGITSPKPCANCVRHKEEECKVELRSGRCSHCTRHGRKCDLIVTSQEWTSMKLERQELCRQINNADRNIEELLHKRLELRKRWDNLEGRATEAIVREQINIEALERLEAATSMEPAMSTECLNGMDIPEQGFDEQDDLQVDVQSWGMIECLRSDTVETINFISEVSL